MTDTTHLSALRVRLSNERNYMARAKTNNERELRKVWIAQIEKEIATELKFIGIEVDPIEAMSDDELLKALQG